MLNNENGENNSRTFPRALAQRRHASSHYNVNQEHNETTTTPLTHPFETPMRACVRERALMSRMNCALLVTKAGSADRVGEIVVGKYETIIIM